MVARSNQFLVIFRQLGTQLRRGPRSLGHADIIASTRLDAPGPLDLNAAMSAHSVFLPQKERVVCKPGVTTAVG